MQLPVNDTDEAVTAAHPSGDGCMNEVSIALPENLTGKIKYYDILLRSEMTEMVIAKLTVLHPSVNTAAKKPWLFGCCFAADNNLTTAMLDNIDWMELTGSDENTHVVKNIQQIKSV